MKAKKTRLQAIRELILANPEAKNETIRHLMLKQGFAGSLVSTNLICGVRMRLAKTKRPSAAKNGRVVEVRVIPHGSRLERFFTDLDRTSAFVIACGGISAAKEELEIFERLKEQFESSE